MTDLDKMYYDWKLATADLKWGVQKAFRSVLEAAQEGQTTLNYGTDYSDGGACLVNTVGVMLTTGGGHGVPMANFSSVVILFDHINSALADVGVNTEYRVVSPLAADILLTHFAPEKPEPDISPKIPVTISTTDISVPENRPSTTGHMSDAEFAEQMEALFTNVEVVGPITVEISETADAQ